MVQTQQTLTQVNQGSSQNVSARIQNYGYHDGNQNYHYNLESQHGESVYKVYNMQTPIAPQQNPQSPVYQGGADKTPKSGKTHDAAPPRSLHKPDLKEEKNPASENMN